MVLREGGEEEPLTPLSNRLWNRGDMGMGDPNWNTLLLSNF